MTAPAAVDRWKAPTNPVDALLRLPLALTHRRQAISNAIRHARASSASIVIAASDAEVQLTTEDAGSGFDVIAAEVGGRGTGLFMLRERMALLGGSLEIVSHLGEGTRIRARLPR